MIINEGRYKIIKQVEDKLCMSYIDDIYWRDKDNYNGYIEAETLLDIIENLMGLIEEKEDIIEELKHKDYTEDSYEEYLLREMGEI